MRNLILSMFNGTISHQLRHPMRGISGWLILQWLKINNTHLEKNAARFLNIEPHHKVLEVGFGPGIGLEEAVKFVKDGPGKIYGIDLSNYMVDLATWRLARPITDAKVELLLGNVEALPYPTNYFDRVFHTNSYYYWPNLHTALENIQRVMKPEAQMVTALNLARVRRALKEGICIYCNPDPERYMHALEATGFKNVRMEDFKDGRHTFQAIFAQAFKQAPVSTTHLEQTPHFVETLQAARARNI